jgi:hypothetical protein
MALELPNDLTAGHIPQEDLLVASYRAEPAVVLEHSCVPHLRA